MDKLLNHKCIRPPAYAKGKSGKSITTSSSGSSVDLSKQAYDCLAEMDKTLRQILKTYAPAAQKKSLARLSDANAMILGQEGLPVNLKSATDVLCFGKTRRWIQ